MLIFALASLMLIAPLIEIDPVTSIHKPCIGVTLAPPPNFTEFADLLPANAIRAPVLPT